MQSQHPIAVIGAGVIGASLAYALARDGQRVLLIDRAAPGMAGASFGNAGHIAAELVEPLPSRALLLGFWRELTTFGGPLEIPLRRIPALLPWSARFALAAFRRERNTRHLAPIVRPSVEALERLLTEIGRRDLLKRNGHYEVWLGHCSGLALAQADSMRRLGIRTEPAPRELLDAVRSAASAQNAVGLWFPDCAHVVDPLEVVRAFALAAESRGAAILRREVKALRRSGDGLSVETDDGRIGVRAAVVCCGAWSASLLRPFGANVPLESARGYHVEMPGLPALADAPILYSNERVLITPMTARLRATSFMEFREPDAPPDEHKPMRLRRVLAGLGYASGDATTSWVGSRPVLPDYLPAMGRMPHVPGLYYSFGHQHIGLTLSAMAAGLMAELVTGRGPSQDLAPFSIDRFGRRATS